MKEDLRKLLDTQNIDLEIDQLNRNKKEYPHEIKNLDQEREDLKQTLETVKTSIVEKEKNRRNIEDEIKAEREILEFKEKRLLDTKTNKEYNAVQSEIESARARIDNLETEDLELMTELDKLVPESKELEKKRKETKKINTKKIAEIQDKFDSIESDIRKLEHQRNIKLKDIDSKILTVYTRLRKGKSNRAVAIVDPIKHSCRGCFKQLPPQKVLEVRRSDKAIFCENCGRILVWNSDNE